MATNDYNNIRPTQDRINSTLHAERCKHCGLIVEIVAVEIKDEKAWVRREKEDVIDTIMPMTKLCRDCTSLDQILPKELENGQGND